VRLELLLAPLREQRLRAAVTLLALALGVALCSAVYLVNAGALDEFGQAARRLVGDADLVVRGPRTGFPDSLYGELARLPGIDIADPMLELDAAVAGSATTLHILGLDPFRASSIQPELLGEFGRELRTMLDRDGIFLSAEAAARLRSGPGDHLDVIVGARRHTLRVLGILSERSYPGQLGVMDIAQAQWIFERVGRLNRVDLRLLPDASRASVERELAQRLPPGVHAVLPEVERDRAVTVTRAYRVNLNMLALVALLTGSFLVFSTQTLSVLRRRSSLALLRALGLTRGELERLLLAEGLVLGFVGACIGVAVGQGVARGLLRLIAGDLGNGALAVHGPELRPQPLAWFAFILIGTTVAGLGAWIPARAAARRPPAEALKGADVERDPEPLRTVPAGLCLLALGALLAFVPAVGGLPLFGYAAIAALLFGAVLLVPPVASRLLAFAPTTGRLVPDTAVAALRGRVGQSTISLAAIIVSFSLMIAMAIMVYSFRESFERWLDHILPADLELRVAQASDTAYLGAAEQALIRTVPGVARADFRRSQLIALAGDRPPVLLVARDIDAARAADELTLVRGLEAPTRAPPLPPIWVSEAMVDQYGARLGARFALPLSGQRIDFQVAGIFRDYGRSSGSVVIARELYQSLTRDGTATEGSLWLARGANPPTTVAAIRARLPSGDSIELRSTGDVRELSLRIFDRAFAVTYVLEAIAVLIGLLGVSFAASSTTLARRAEFGMLRHIGMRRRQVQLMLASEGLAMSLLGVVYGLGVGVCLSVVLVYVVNRQSFGWSVDLAIPWRQIAGFSLSLIAASGLTATFSGRAAMSVDALRAVREDW
jgi:putative ABC transport system permease protein